MQHTWQGQFDEVKDKEIRDITEACVSVGLSGGFELVFIVCQMRTRARFRLTDQELQQQQRGGGGGGRGGGGRRNDDLNVKSGTVVDTDITGADEDFDFYLVPHKALKGTSRPSHYHVLQNDPELWPDDLQRFTFDLCHLYPVATKVVSRPAPVYLAHRAAYVAPYYEAGWKEEDGRYFDDIASVSSGSAGVTWAGEKGVGKEMMETVYYA